MLMVIGIIQTQTGRMRIVIFDAGIETLLIITPNHDLIPPPRALFFPFTRLIQPFPPAFLLAISINSTVSLTNPLSVSRRSQVFLVITVVVALIRSTRRTLCISFCACTSRRACASRVAPLHIGSGSGRIALQICNPEHSIDFTWTATRIPILCSWRAGVNILVVVDGIATTGVVFMCRSL